jgi:hypothetical protein
MLDWFQPVTWVFIILAAVWLDFRLMRYLKANKDRLAPVVIFGRRIPVLSAVYIIGIGIQSWIKQLGTNSRNWFNHLSFSVVTDSLRSFHPVQIRRVKAVINEKAHANILTKILPIVIICAWAIWVGRGYLNFDPTAFINGGDYPHQIYNHYAWHNLTKCGSCVFWNGFMDGGQPTFAEVQGAALHPLVIVTTLLWGAVNGSKVIMIVSLITIGLAQWWLARVMGLGVPAAAWAGIMAITGGHLADRMGIGLVNIVLTMACATLMLPPLIDLLHHKNKRASLWIGVFLGLTILSGQAYLQVAIVMGLAPAVLIYWLSQRNHFPELRVQLMFSICLALLISAVLWVPLLRFLPYVSKDGDPYLASVLALNINPLKLILQDEKSLFIGWVPVLLAFSTLHFVPKNQKRLMWFLFLAAALIFIISSADFLRFVHKYFEQVGYLRFAFHMSLLAVPFIIALAAWGLDYLLKVPISISILNQSGGSITFYAIWILLPLVMLLTIPPVYKFSRWRYDVHKVERPELVMQWFKTDSTEIIRVPMPDYDWTPLAIERGFKSTGVFRSWFWKDREEPTPYLEATWEPVNEYEWQYENLYLIRRGDARYASISTPDGGFFPCQAKAVGGHIDVSCTSNVAGTLTVQENYYSGWTVKVDGVSAPLYKSDWLKVAAPPGTHLYTFRYRPWDVWVGMAISLIGIVVAVFAWKKDRV